MLSEKDKAFIKRWENVRLTESTFKHKILSGMPMAMLFAVPVALFFVIVKIFFPSWFATATHRKTEVVVPGLTEQHMSISAGNIITAFIAVLIVVLFFAYFRMHYKWENNEQLYQELKSKEKKR
jgi:mannose/fructose/N-acetylgalactosamine-specific phosphotransferase system component IIC